MKINSEDEILFIRGSIPGPKGSWLEIRDAAQKPHRLPPPFPTYVPQPNSKNKKKYMRLRYFDPFYKDRHTDFQAKWEEARKALKSKPVEDDDDEAGDKTPKPFKGT